MPNHNKQHPASKRLPRYSRGVPGKEERGIRTRRTIDHSKRPHHDRFGREIPPWKPEDDEPPRNDKGQIICGADLSRGRTDPNEDYRCHGLAMPNGRCKFHGGKTPVGEAHPAFKHGRYSVEPLTRMSAKSKYTKHLPDRLVADFIESIDDPNKLAMEEEIALLQTRINELLRSLDIAATAEAWERARDLKNEMLRANRSRDVATFQARFEDLSAILDKGHHDFAAWEQIARFTERLRKVKETEIKRVQLAQETMTQQQALAFLSSVAGIIRSNVSDPHLLTKISNEFARLTGPTTGSYSDPGDTIG